MRKRPNFGSAIVALGAIVRLRQPCTKKDLRSRRRAPCMWGGEGKGVRGARASPQREQTPWSNARRALTRPRHRQERDGAGDGETRRRESTWNEPHGASNDTIQQRQTSRVRARSPSQKCAKSLDRTPLQPRADRPPWATSTITSSCDSEVLWWASGDHKLLKIKLFVSRRPAWVGTAIDGWGAIYRVWKAQGKAPLCAIMLHKSKRILSLNPARRGVRNRSQWRYIAVYRSTG